MKQIESIVAVYMPLKGSITVRDGADFLAVADVAHAQIILDEGDVYVKEHLIDN